MPESSAELDELRRRIDEQSQRIEELQDEHGITGRRRIALNAAINGVLSRAQGHVRPLSSRVREELLEDYPALANAYASGPIDWDEAVRIVGEVLGSEHLGRQALDAHRARGLGQAGHRALSS